MRAKRLAEAMQNHHVSVAYPQRMNLLESATIADRVRVVFGLPNKEVPVLLQEQALELRHAIRGRKKVSIGSFAKTSSPPKMGDAANQ